MRADPPIFGGLANRDRRQDPANTDRRGEVLGKAKSIRVERIVTD
jgi:hypothetical protein